MVPNHFYCVSHSIWYKNDKTFFKHIKDKHENKIQQYNKFHNEMCEEIKFTMNEMKSNHDNYCEIHNRSFKNKQSYINHMKSLHTYCETHNMIFENTQS